MKSDRKTICLITAIPEYTHAQRTLDGVFTQCRKYGYQVAVFGSIANLMLNDKQYVAGECKIYDLINFSRFDGVIVDTVTLSNQDIRPIFDRLVDRMQKECCAPVVSLELPLWDYPCIQNENEEILREICRHVILHHGKRKLCVLTGPNGTPVAENRLAIFLDEIKQHGITVPEEHIRHGDFWYSSGEQR